MSAYTEKMVSELAAAGSFNYDSASAFASQHGLSVRSVISKIKHLGLDYTPRPVVKKTDGVRVTKMEVVEEIARLSGANFDAIAGLSKADMRSLQEVLRAFSA